MEKKKLLLVAISVGIFLVIAIGAAILVFSPQSADPSSAVTRSTIQDENGISYLSGTQNDNPAGQAFPGQSQAVPQDAVELVRNPNEIPGLRADPAEGRESPDYHVTGTPPAGTTISVPRPSTVAVPAPAPRAAPEPRITPAPQAAPAPTPAPAPQATPTPAPAPSTPAPAPRASRVQNDFWVQTGSFSSIARAEGAKASLADRGITSIIENREVDGRPFFRVRVGPYTSQNEADYWLNLIQEISGFEDSQVLQTQRQI